MANKGCHYVLLSKTQSRRIFLQSSLTSPDCFMSQAATGLSDAFALLQVRVNQIHLNLCVSRTRQTNSIYITQRCKIFCERW